MLRVSKRQQGSGGNVQLCGEAIITGGSYDSGMEWTAAGDRVEILEIVAYRGGVRGVQTPTSEIRKALQNRAIFKPIVKTVKSC